MADSSGADFLEAVPLFESLSIDERRELADRLVPRSVPRGSDVFQVGSAGSSMFLVKEGNLRVHLPTLKGPPVVLQELVAGNYFGELALFDDKPRSASVSAVTDAVLFELRRQDMEDFLRRHHDVSIKVLRGLTARLRATTALVGERAAKDVVREFDERLTWGQRMADKVAELNGSWAFILSLIVLTVAWAVVNRMTTNPWDEYPYQFYNLALAILVALQGPLIVMSQNRQTMKDRAQAENDFRVNLKNEVGIERLQEELQTFRAEFDRLAAKVDGGEDSKRAS
jgi:CRP/FNR family cyclic AMP-dependent transcriptional regulator